MRTLPAALIFVTCTTACGGPGLETVVSSSRCPDMGVRVDVDDLEALNATVTAEVPVQSRLVAQPVDGDVQLSVHVRTGADRWSSAPRPARIVNGLLQIHFDCATDPGRIAWWVE